MKKIIYILLGVAILGCTSNKNNQHTFTTTCDNEFFSDSICTLQENISIVGEISSFDIVDSNQFVVTSVIPANVILYKKNGNQVQEIGEVGNGPFEYYRPSIVKVYNDMIYVWCSQLLKLIVFDLQGDPLNEYTNFRKSIKKFDLYDDMVCFYLSGGYESIIEIYSLSTGELVKSLGKSTEEHELLNIASSSGSLALSPSYLYYTLTDNLSIYQIGLSDFNAKKHTLEDNDFSVKKIKHDAGDLINTDRKSALEYSLENSMVTGLFCTTEHLIITSETGHYEHKGLQIKSHSERRVKFYLLNHKMETITSYTNRLEERGHYSAFGSTLYGIILKVRSDYEYDYVLKKSKHRKKP